jgi:hypothetical protein
MALQFVTSQIKDAAISNAKLAGSIVDSKLNQITTSDKVAGSALQLAGSGGLEDDSGIKISASGVTNAMLAGSIAASKLAGSIGDGKLSQITTADKVAGSAVELSANTAFENSSGLRLKSATAGGGLTMSAAQVMAVSVDDSSIEIDSDSLRIKASGITNAMLAGSIANAKLINSSVAYGGVTLALGASDATPAFDLTDATNYPTSSLTGTITNAQLAGSIAFSKLADAANICRLDQTENIAAVWAFGTNLPTASANPTGDTQLARKAYVDSVAQGLDIKDSVKAATTANISLSGTQTIDGVGVLADDRVLVKNQSTGTENGIYICAAGSWSRASDFAAGEDESGAFCFVEQGTVNAESGFVCTNNKGSATVGTHALTFSQFSGAGQVIAGDGLDKSGNTLSVNVDDSGIEINADTLRLKDGGIGPAKLADDCVDASKIADTAVGTAALANNSVTIAKFGMASVFERTAVSGGATSSINLGNQITEADFRNGGNVAVYRNGQRLYYKASPGDNSEYSVADNGSTTSVSFGAALEDGDEMFITYMH